MRGGPLADLPLFLVPLPICFFSVFLSVCVLFFQFFLLFAFFPLFLLLLLLLLLLVLVFLLVLLVFVVLLFFFSSYYFFFLFFIFICFLFLFLFFLFLFFLLISQKDTQKRQTGLIIDGKHSNILVFSCTSHEAKEKCSIITQTLIRCHHKKKRT